MNIKILKEYIEYCIKWEVVPTWLGARAYNIVAREVAQYVTF